MAFEVLVFVAFFGLAGAAGFSFGGFAVVIGL
jgi:hypothetical protein